MEHSRRLILNWGVLALLFAFCPSIRAEPDLTIVLDLDETLIFRDVRHLDSVTQKSFDKRDATTQGNGKYYRLANGTREFVLSLLDLSEEIKVEVGVFSAHRDTQRTVEVSQNMWKTRRAEFVSPFSFVMGYESVDKFRDEFSSEFWRVQPENSVFTGDTKKDLKKIPNRGKSVILIDDSPSVMMRGQEKSLIWIRNRTKEGELFRVRGLIDAAVELARNQKIKIEEALWKLQWKRSPNGGLEYNFEKCDHPSLYLRGMERMRHINPWVETRPENFEKLKPSKEISIEPQIFPRIFRPDLFLLKPVPPEPIPPLIVSRPKPLSLAELDGSVELRKGQTILIGGIEERVDFLHKESENTRLYVFEKRGIGPAHALKINRRQTTESLERMEEEQTLFAHLLNHRLPHARVLSKGPHYIFREWAEGVTAEAWLEAWTKNGGPMNDPRAQGLQTFLTYLIGNNIYLTQMRPKDIIWNGRNWVVVNAGAVKDDLPAKQVWNNYQDRFQRRWSLKLGITCQTVIISLLKKP